MFMGLNEEINSYFRELGGGKIGIASANRPWIYATNSQHPRDIMSECNSVIVLAIGTGLNDFVTANFGGKSIDVDGKTYRVSQLFIEWLTYRVAGFLRRKGFKTFTPIDWTGSEAWLSMDKRIHKFSFKLAAYEAGIGVFGKCGLIITPEYGLRTKLGVVMTDALLEPTGKIEDFNPCINCTICAENCPVKAIDSTLPPPKGFNRDKCLKFYQYLRKSTNWKIIHCAVCFEVCPIAKNREYTLERHNTFLSIDEVQRKKLIEDFNYK